MLEYFKTILKKVSFDIFLFEKELRKALETLVAEEKEKLRNWCYNEFQEQYPVVLQRCFA